jgi:peroxiredoxin
MLANAGAKSRVNSCSSYSPRDFSGTFWFDIGRNGFGILGDPTSFTMNKQTYLLLLACLLSTTAAALGGVNPGDEAPAFTLEGADGDRHNLSYYSGMYVVLEWCNHACTDVQTLYASGNIQATQETQTAQGVVWLSILSSAPGKPGYATPEQALGTAKACGSDATEILLDPTGKVGKAYGATRTPEIFIINPEGDVFYHGAFDHSPATAPTGIKKPTNYVSTAIAEAKSGKPVSQAKTELHGCQIQYRD